ncbi:hypothetical protein CC85DRAFT_289581 [Cutaneotrichosporon oleaginosum]|uniref:Uncharacterized protein n=1 Tax=Cutaneotrichosporon oleaginosum TaxID=879819 RepID=A0A0J0XBA2_9TREE|nr:uncharacterized protein CC85DRAFT_289581 [Cutaneotrichosporon oleaginosum]KLT38366.1 hypothetical protein CC85DRAFT_289581 [Cutaneotrichosporon oleaginosum]TXT07568.1 hypothetical protein COLE_04492 [Cutaneotrichosporon oleaginosum]
MSPIEASRLLSCRRLRANGVERCKAANDGWAPLRTVHLQELQPCAPLANTWRPCARRTFRTMGSMGRLPTPGSQAPAPVAVAWWLWIVPLVRCAPKKHRAPPTCQPWRTLRTSAHPKLLKHPEHTAGLRSRPFAPCLTLVIHHSSLITLPHIHSSAPLQKHICHLLLLTTHLVLSSCLHLFHLSRLLPCSRCPSKSRPLLGQSSSSHFDQTHYRSYNVFQHRPHKTLRFFLNAILATALFRIWPTLLFFGGWSTMVVLINLKTSAKLSFPSVMITVLGMLLGLTISYRTSSAYEKYTEGRKMWAQIITATRNWARMVWIHCPDSLQAEPIEDPAERARDEARALIEKKTVVQLGLAFAVAVKHYLRDEPGIYYEDLYHLVSFIPTLSFPSGITTEYANIAPNLPMLSAGPIRPHAHRQATDDSSKSDPIVLCPAENPIKFSFTDLWPSRWKKHTHKLNPMTGDDMDVPLKIITFMSSWLAAVQKRKVIDPSTTTNLMLPLSQLNDALAALERILTTPIPWSYNAHIYEMSWIYCLALPFQLWDSKLKWVTVPATVITAYFVLGYASIAEEIENPFGLEKNDLNLHFFCQEIIAKELDAITSRSYTDPGDWIFSSSNHPFGQSMPSAERMQSASPAELRRILTQTRNNFGSSSSDSTKVSA